HAALHRALYEYQGPVAVRYPRGGELAFREDTMANNVAVVRAGSDITIVSYGILLNEAISAAQMLQENGFSTEIIKLNELTGGYEEALASVRKTGRVVVAEECVEAGCVAQTFALALSEAGVFPRAFRAVNLGNRFIPQASVRELYARYGIDANGIADAAREALKHD
ncbi:MAG: 1-deoxy-D-xylulose-5-phosphate synthase, partial [Clostridia bacterium]|nr:1-deoxy-D-xylulose-5-phosphate synthase [Clostridia bacterium]